MDQVETRELTYFVTVAEELHFGRAADRLGIAQPPLSRAIAQLERRIGVRLFDRTSRSVSLSPAGVAFLDAAGIALTAVERAVSRARAAAGPVALSLAVRPGVGVGILRDALATYGTKPGALPVELCFVDDPRSAVLEGAADVALICRNNDLQGLGILELATEDPVALVPEDHPLTRQAAVTVADLRADARYTDECPHESLDIITGMVSLGQLVTVVGDSAVDRLGSSIKAVPVVDLPTTTLVLIWRPESINQARAHLVDTAANFVVRPSLRAVHAVD
jgi:DNA-binding transcriptional LysR family regulator